MFRKEKSKVERSVNLRIALLSIITVLAYAVLYWQLYRVHVLESEKLVKLASRQYIGKVSLRATRGRIYDSKGVVLAYTGEIYSLALRPAEVKDKFKLYRVLTSHGIPYEALQRALSSPYPFVYVLRKSLSPQKAFELQEVISSEGLTGVVIEQESTGKREYPVPSTYNVVGFVGIDGNGLDGIEYTYNDYLKGKDGYITLEYDGRDNPLYFRVHKHVPPENGYDVYLTLDSDLQTILTDLAEEAVTELDSEEIAIMVIDTQGRALAMVSVLSSKNPLVKRHGKLFSNTCVTWGLEPGSVIKPFTISAGINEGLNPYDKYFSGPVLKVGGWYIHNADDGLWTTGTETMEDIIKYSFNIGTASVALKLGPDKLGTYFKALGFDKPSGIQLPGDFTGNIPDYERDYSGIYTATSSYGQGIALSLAQLLRAYTALANDGLMVRELTVVEKVVRTDGEIVYRYKPEYVRIFKPEVAKLVRKFLREVVVGGTGRRAELIGYWPGGKTGTANQAREGKYSYYTGMFIGMFPIDEPQFIIGVRVTNPKGKAWGGLVAAPIFKEVVLRIIALYHIPPSEQPEFRELEKLWQQVSTRKE